MSTVCSLMCLLLMTHATAFAQQDVLKDIKIAAIDVEFSCNFDSVLSSEGPCHLALLISNFSQQPIEGRLYLCDVTGRRIELTDLYLVPQQTQRFAWIRNLSNWYNPYVELTKSDKIDDILFRQSLDYLQSSNGETYILLVSDSTLDFELPSAELSQTNFNSQNSTYWYEDQLTQLYSKDGFYIETANARPWELPDHYGPLTEFPAIVIAENTNLTNLTPAQWQALAEWVTMGGQLYFFHEVKDFRKTFAIHCPTPMGPIQDENGLDAWYCGAGRLLEFNRPVFGSNVNDEFSIGRIISRRTAQGVLQHPTKMLVTDSFRRRGDVEPNRIKIVGGIVLYGLLSGLVTMLMFRRTQRQVAIYLSSIVALTTCCAVVLGVQIRNSKGRAFFQTVTQVGPEGSVQYGVARLYSSGGVNQPLTLTGNQPELRLCQLDREDIWYDQTIGYLPAYDYDGARPKSSKINKTIPIGPWGTRDFFVSDFPEGDLRFQIKLEVSANNYNRRQLTLRATPPAGVEFRKAILLITEGQDSKTWKQSPQNAAVELLNLPQMVPGQEFTVESTVVPQNYSSQGISLNLGTNRGLKMGTAPVQGTHAWIVGQLGKSTGMKIDDTVGYDIDWENHFYIQKLTPAEIIVQPTSN